MLTGKEASPSADTAEEIRRLEELWAAPSAPDHDHRRSARVLVAQATRKLVDRALAHLGWTLAAVWLVFVGSLLAAAPASQESYTPPLWVDAVVTAFWLTLAVAALAGMARLARAGYAASLAASGACLGLAIACTVTDHHTGGWWAYELGGALALGALSALGLRRAWSSRPAG
jgi:membrane associated rhomboid family serine protease